MDELLRLLTVMKKTLQSKLYGDSEKDHKSRPEKVEMRAPPEKQGLSAEDKRNQQRASVENGGLSNCFIKGFQPVDSFDDTFSKKITKNVDLPQDGGKKRGGKKGGGKKESARKGGGKNGGGKKGGSADSNHVYPEDVVAFRNMKVLNKTIQTMNIKINSIDARVNKSWKPVLCTRETFYNWLMHASEKNKQSILRTVQKLGKFTPKDGQKGAGTSMLKSLKGGSKKGGGKKSTRREEESLLSKVLPVGMVPKSTSHGEKKDMPRYVYWRGEKVLESNLELWESIWEAYGEERFYLCGNPTCAKCGCDLMFHNGNDDNPFEAHYRTKHLTFFARYCLDHLPAYKEKAKLYKKWWDTFLPLERTMIEKEYQRIEAAKKEKEEVEEEVASEDTSKSGKKKGKVCNVGHREGKGEGKLKISRQEDKDDGKAKTAKQERNSSMSNEEWIARDLKKERELTMKKYHEKGVKGSKNRDCARKFKSHKEMNGHEGDM